MYSAADLLRRMAIDTGRPIIMPYEVGQLIHRLFDARGYGSELLPRRNGPLTERRFSQLLNGFAHRGYGLEPGTEPVEIDRDFDSLVFRLTPNPPGTAAEVISLADPLAYLSHGSALEAHGIAPAPSPTLHVTRPVSRLWHEAQRRRLAADYSDEMPRGLIVVPSRVVLAAEVRGQPVAAHETINPADMVPLGRWARASSVGRTFVDTLDAPEHCGGIAAVVAIWDRHARRHLEAIIAAVDAAPAKIIKVRAGYLLEERLGVRDPRIEAWVAAAQRGSSRKLDASAPYAPRFSAKWMLSLNVEDIHFQGARARPPSPS